MSPATLAAAKALVRFLEEFGYMHAAGGDVRVAFRMARTERGPNRLARELDAHEREHAASDLLRKSAHLTVRQMHGEPERAVHSS